MPLKSLLPSLLLLLLFIPSSASAQENTWEIHEESATRSYNTLWERVDRFFGANGMPAPRVKMDHKLGPTYAWVYTTLDGYKEVTLFRRTMRWLGSDKAQLRIYAKTIILHEWAHIYQRLDLWPDELLLPGNGRERRLEGLAEIFSWRVGEKLLGFQPQWARQQRFIGDGYYLYWANWAKRTFSSRYILRGQFEGLWGADPTWILWPKNTPKTF